jgi:hypothetical protein
MFKKSALFSIIFLAVGAYFAQTTAMHLATRVSKFAKVPKGFSVSTSPSSVSPQSFHNALLSNPILFNKLQNYVSRSDYASKDFSRTPNKRSFESVVPTKKLIKLYKPKQFIFSELAPQTYEASMYQQGAKAIDWPEFQQTVYVPEELTVEENKELYKKLLVESLNNPLTQFVFITKDQQIADLKDRISNLTKQDRMLFDQKNAELDQKNAELFNQLATVRKASESVQAELDRQARLSDAVTQERNNLRQQNAAQEQQIKDTKQDSMRIAKARDALQSKFERERQSTESRGVAAQKELNDLREQIQNYEKQLQEQVLRHEELREQARLDQVKQHDEQLIQKDAQAKQKLNEQNMLADKKLQEAIKKAATLEDELKAWQVNRKAEKAKHTQSMADQGKARKEVRAINEHARKVQAKKLKQQQSATEVARKELEQRLQKELAQKDAQIKKQQEQQRLYVKRVEATEQQLKAAKQILADQEQQLKISTNKHDKLVQGNQKITLQLQQAKASVSRQKASYAKLRKQHKVSDSATQAAIQDVKRKLVKAEKLVQSREKQLGEGKVFVVDLEKRIKLQAGGLNKNADVITKLTKQLKEATSKPVTAESDVQTDVIQVTKAETHEMGIGPDQNIISVEALPAAQAAPETSEAGAAPEALESEELKPELLDTELNETDSSIIKNDNGDIVPVRQSTRVDVSKPTEPIIKYVVRYPQLVNRREVTTAKNLIDRDFTPESKSLHSTRTKPNGSDKPDGGLLLPLTLLDPSERQDDVSDRLDDDYSQDDMWNQFELADYDGLDHIDYPQYDTDATNDIDELDKVSQARPTKRTARQVKTVTNKQPEHRVRPGSKAKAALGAMRQSPTPQEVNKNYTAQTTSHPTANSLVGKYGKAGAAGAKLPSLPRSIVWSLLGLLVMLAIYLFRRFYKA